MRAAALLVASLLLAPALAAQEFDIFDPNDFLDPRLRGAEFDPGGLRITKDGDNFLVVNGYAGRVTDYQWRNQPTDVDLSFLHVTASRYVGNRQWNLKVTAFDPDEGAAELPRYRLTGQVGYYYAMQHMKPGSSEERGDDRASGRTLFTYTFEKADAESRGARHAHEYGIEIDALIRFRKRRAAASLIWMHRYNGEAVGGSDRITYYYRPPDIDWWRVHLTGGIGAGVERRDGWHAGAMRAVMNASVELPWGFSFNASYAPAYLPALEQRRTYHELAIYVDRTVVAGLW